MGKRQVSLPVSGITGKATTQTSRSLTAMKTKLEIQVRKLKDKDKLKDLLDELNITKIGNKKIKR